MGWGVSSNVVGCGVRLSTSSLVGLPVGVEVSDLLLLLLLLPDLPLLPLVSRLMLDEPLEPLPLLEPPQWDSFSRHISRVMSSVVVMAEEALALRPLAP